MAVPYKNPISSVQVSTPQSVSRTSVFGTNFSNLNVGGYMEVYNLSDLSLTLTASSYPSLIQLSANTIPIRYTKGNGTFLSPDYLTLNSDNISSGRRRLGMMVYVHETDKVYQYVIPNYDTLWNNLSGLTGFSSVTYSDYTTVINSRSSAGQSFISGWTSSTIEGVSGYTSSNANWRIFQTGVGYYGAFSDVTDQFATVINTGYPMLLGVTDLTNGVTVVSGSRVTIANTGIYNIQWSAQFRNPSANIHDVTIWLRKNGVDVPGSSGVVAVTAKHGSFDGHVLPSWNFLLDAIAGDYYEFVWSTDNLAVFISFEPAGSPPPSTASVVLTVTQQSGIMAGTGITSINSLTNATQFLTVGTNTGTTFSIISSGNTHTFNTPKDIFVTGGTYNTGSSSITFTNNTGGTFNITGITTSSTFTGGTVSGATNFTGGLTANTISTSGVTMNNDLTVGTGFTILTKLSTLNAVDDTAAAALGVPLYGLYRNGNAVQIRLV